MDQILRVARVSPSKKSLPYGLTGHFATIRIFHGRETPDWGIHQLFSIILQFEPGFLQTLYARESDSLRFESDCLQALSAQGTGIGSGILQMRF